MFANGLHVEQSMTTPSRPGKSPRPVWNVTGTTDQYSQALYDMGGKKWRGAFSFWEDPSTAIEALGADAALSFAERQELAAERAGNRAERLAERSAAHGQAAEQRFNTAHAIGSMIPFGQPILVGHHSEGRHRRDLAKIETNMRKGIEESNYSAELARRAEHNERKATGDHSPRYLSNRIRETRAELARYQRHVDNNVEVPRFAALVAEYTDRLNYWQAELAAIGGVTYSRETVNVGDEVCIRGRWVEVVRANPTTVSWRDHTISPVWPGKSPWAEVTERRTPA